MYRGILLDVYGTLVHDDDAPLAAVCATVAQAAGGVDAATVEHEWYARICRMADAAFGAGFRSMADLNLASLAETAAHVGADVDVEALCAEQVAFWRRPPLFPDALPFLGAVGVPVCLVSDVDRADLDALLSLHGIRAAAAVSSEDARAYKPRPEPFLLALDRLGLDATDVVHVGDSPSSDIVGAAALGIDSAFVDRGRAPSLMTVRPTYTAASLTALLPHLALSPAPGTGPTT